MLLPLLSPTDTLTLLWSQDMKREAWHNIQMDY